LYAVKERLSFFWLTTIVKNTNFSRVVGAAYSMGPTRKENVCIPQLDVLSFVSIWKENVVQNSWPIVLTPNSTIITTARDQNYPTLT